MSASKFLRNFLILPEMGVKESSCYTTREQEHEDNDLKIQKIQEASMDDECHSIASSNTEICGETEYQDFEIYGEETQETIRKADVNSLPASECDGSFRVNQWSCKVPLLQSVVTKRVGESKDKQEVHIREPPNQGFEATTVEEVKSRPVLMVPVNLCENGTKETRIEKNTSTVSFVQSEVTKQVVDSKDKQDAHIHEPSNQNCKATTGCVGEVQSRPTVLVPVNFYKNGTKETRIEKSACKFPLLQSLVTKQVVAQSTGKQKAHIHQPSSQGCKATTVGEVKSRPIFLVPVNFCKNGTKETSIEKRTGTVPLVQSVIAKQVVESKGKQETHIREPSNQSCKASTASFGEVKSRPIFLVPVNFCTNGIKETPIEKNTGTVPLVQSVVTKQVVAQSKGKQEAHIREPSNQGCKASNSGEVKSRPIFLVPVNVCNNGTRETRIEKSTSNGRTVDTLLKMSENVKHLLQLHVTGRQNAAAKGSNETSLLAGKLVTTKERHLPFMPNGSNTALLSTSKGLNKPIDDWVRKTQEPPMKKIRSYNNGVITVRELLLRKANDQEKNKTDVPSQLKGKGILKLNHCSNKAQQKTIQELVFSSDNCTAVLREQLPFNAGNVETNSQPLELENSRVMEKRSVTTAPSRLTTTNPGSPLTNTNGGIVSAPGNLDYKLYDAVVSESKVAIVREPQTSNTTKTKSSQGKGKCYTSAMNRKRISIASGIVYEDEVSSPEGSQCSATTQTLLSSNNSEAAEEIPVPSYRQANNNHSKSSSGFRHVGSMVSSKVPPGSTLVSDRGVYRIKDKEKPFACAYCGKAYKKKRSLYAHIRFNHDEKRYSCRFCGKRFVDQYQLSQHVTIHTLEKPFTCDQCGMRFRLEVILRRHKFTHAKKKRFPCKIRNKSHTGKRDLVFHSEVHKEEEFREGVSCNICKKEFSHHSMLKEHMTIHTGQNPFKCSLCDKHFRLEIDLQHHMITHNKNGKLLLGDAHDPEENTINVPVPVATCPGKAKFIQCNSKAEEMTTQLLSSNNCNAFAVEQLPNNSDVVESNIHPFPLEPSQVQAKPSLPVAPIGLPTANSRSQVLLCTKSGLVSVLKNSSDNLYNKVVSESKVRESWISNTLEAKSNNSEGKCCSSKSVNGKLISSAAAIVFEDEVSSRESSQCSTTTKTLVLLTDKEHPSSSSRQSVNDNGKSSFRSPLESTMSSKSPPGATLLNYRHVIYTKGKEKPYACAHCGKAYTNRHSVHGHVMYKHKEKRNSCEFCGKRYADQKFLSQHVRIHTQEKPFTCDQCGLQFRFETVLRSHKYTHSEERLFPCNKCSKSFKTSNVLSRHKESHNKDEQRKGVICNICKRKFRNPSILKKHMMIHTGEKPFKCSLCDKQFRTKILLRSHVDSHSGKRRLANKPCSVCGKTVWANYMTTHMRMHAGEKPFECNICGKRFPKKQNLEGHMRSHTGEKPFACGGCDKRFALYSNMMSHKAKCNSDNVI